MAISWSDWQFMEDGAREFVGRLEDIARHSLSPEAKAMTADDRRQLTRAMEKLRPAFDELAQVIETMRPDSASRTQLAYASIHKIMEHAFNIGVYATVTDSAGAYARNGQAALAQRAKVVRADERKRNLRAAIIAESAGIPLIGSIKFAESIRGAVGSRLGNPSGKGYSARSIQREICAILKERSEG
jgi:hypothetical protein